MEKGKRKKWDGMIEKIGYKKRKKKEIGRDREKDGGRERGKVMGKKIS